MMPKEYFLVTNEFPFTPLKPGSKTSNSKLLLFTGHQERLQYNCPHCGKNYCHKRTLTFHVRYECGKEPSVHCPFCLHRSKKKNNMLAHIKRAHPEANEDSVRALLRQLRC